MKLPALAALAPLRPTQLLTFDPAAWQSLQQSTARQLRCQPAELGRLHEIEAARGDAPRKSRWRTQGQRCDPAALEELVSSYRRLVCEVVAPHVAEGFDGPCHEVVFQSMPSLRVVTPGDKPSGRRHNDAMYCHQPGQINFWMPLAPAFGNNTLWVELGGDGTDLPLEGDFGTMHRFHGHELYHYTRPNDTPATRVSLDFRVVPGPCYDDDWPGSRDKTTGRQSFFVGGYYTRARFDRATGAWRVCEDGEASVLRGNAVARGGAEAVGKAPHGADAATDPSDLGLISRGRLVVREGWLPFEMVEALRADAHALDASGAFSPSGVAIGGTDGQYGEHDRRVCVLSADVEGDRLARREFDGLLEELRAEVEARWSGGKLVCAEQYYSLHAAGARLGMHMDERHEETKGVRGWQGETRRAVSWLVYLGGEGWDRPGGAGSGGHLRAHCRTGAAHAPCGAHEGDLLVGWLQGAAGGDDPVFLDSWVREAANGRAAADRQEEHVPRWRARSALYRLGATGAREYLTAPFGADSPTWPVEMVSGGAPDAFGTALRAQLRPELQDTFSFVEETEHPSQTVVEVAPAGGTLVLFDSVTVPHEVLPTERGERVALAGWFHTAQQEFPEWYGE